ncbi:MAG: tRNA (adenosine(37)-N6)-threonylcarbamoyltransferase complex transferase subunit TsaD [Candidatus Terrybacteria bacterium]|nr:tRNA (adenosine(37)-N6)-threonylcarbamoyltransferase complex transferase subunit TsaD [Candidatus Terrybacteria bacterium]
MIILAIETSCDETAIAVLEIKRGKFRILSNVVASQVKIHAHWGGVVPNLAKREHQRNLPIVLKKALKKIPNSKFLIPKIDLIAVTIGPGLEPALWTGINFARDLSKVWGKPIIGINHMEGHILSVFLNRKEFLIFNFQPARPSGGFPILALLVSGGHTELVLMRKWLDYKIIGQTLDDAAGEAFDKVAKMLGLPYPGGPQVAKFADSHQSSVVSSQIKLPRPMINSKNYDFSFSGLKTAVLYKIKELRIMNKELRIAICAEFQQAVIDVLISKTIRAAKEYKVKTIILGGGVAANNELRKQLSCQLSAVSRKLNFLLPAKNFTGDNAAMIAVAAYFRAKKKQFSKSDNLKADGNLKLS